jgi:hypothetical protein
MWDFVMDKSGAGAGFLRELRFPLTIYIPSASPQSSSLSPEADTIGQEWPHKPELKKSIHFPDLLNINFLINYLAHKAPVPHTSLFQVKYP